MFVGGIPAVPVEPGGFVLSVLVISRWYLVWAVALPWCGVRCFVFSMVRLVSGEADEVGLDVWQP